MISEIRAIRVPENDRSWSKTPRRRETSPSQSGLGRRRDPKEEAAAHFCTRMAGIRLMPEGSRHRITTVLSAIHSPDLQVECPPSEGVLVHDYTRGSRRLVPAWSAQRPIEREVARTISGGSRLPHFSSGTAGVLRKWVELQAAPNTLPSQGIRN